MERFEDLPDVRDGIRRAVKRHGERRAQEPTAAPADADPTFHYRRKIANFCETACRLFNDIENLPTDAELPQVRALLDTTGKKLRAAVMAATEP